MGVVATVAAVLIVLFTAPFVLGAYVVAQGGSRELLMRWFGFLTLLFVLALLAGIVAAIALAFLPGPYG